MKGLSNMKGLSELRKTQSFSDLKKISDSNQGLNLVINSSKETKLTPEQTAFKIAMKPFGWGKLERKIILEADNGKKPTPPPKVSAYRLLNFIIGMATEGLNLIIEGGNLLRKQTPVEIMNIVEQAKKQVDAPAVETPFNGLSGKTSQLPQGMPQGMKGGMTEDMTEDMTENMTEDMTGGITISKPSFKIFNKMLFSTAYIPGILTLFAFAFLIFYLLLTLIQWILNKITKAFGSDKKTLPTIKFNKKTTQTVYSIFFVITSWFLMFYLFIDYFRKLGPELDTVQIFKQLIGASYILWPMSVLIIGSGISKAFYKISCNGNKPNVLSWAKIVESSALYVLGICVVITLILLFKPIVWIYNKFPKIMKDKFSYVDNLLAITLKLMVIYILLRMLTVMIEDIISNKIVFFISKVSKDVEPPPVDCNVEEKKTAKQSEMAKTLEEIYMYISGIIVCIIAIFILVIQCPHPWSGSTININHIIGAVCLQLTDISTRFILQNKDRKVDSKEKNKRSKSGLGFSSLLSGNKDEVAPLDSTADAYTITAPSAKAPAPAPPATLVSAPATTALKTTLASTVNSSTSRPTGNIIFPSDGIPNFSAVYDRTHRG